MSDALATLLSGSPVAAREVDGMIAVELAGREFRSRPPAVAELPAGLLHLGPWRVAPGGALDEGPDTEQGLRAGYHRAVVDDGDWAACARINEISIGAPSWESDSFRGWVWYRGDVRIPAGWAGDGRLVLGSPTECRRLGWSVYLDGAELTDGVVDAPVLELDIAADRLTPGVHRLAVRQRVTADVPVERRQELEGWRRIDVFCQQTLTQVATLPARDRLRPRLDRRRPAGLRGCEQSVADRVALDGVCRRAARASTLTRLGAATVLSDVTVAELDEPATIVHPEGFWAGLSGGAAVAATPTRPPSRSGPSAASPYGPGRVCGWRRASPSSCHPCSSPSTRRRPAPTDRPAADPAGSTA